MEQVLQRFLITLTFLNKLTFFKWKQWRLTYILDCLYFLEIEMLIKIEFFLEKNWIFFCLISLLIESLSLSVDLWYSLFMKFYKKKIFINLTLFIVIILIAEFCSLLSYRIRFEDTIKSQSNISDNPTNFQNLFKTIIF